jgi:hypothetical protein
VFSVIQDLSELVEDGGSRRPGPYALDLAEADLEAEDQQDGNSPQSPATKTAGSTAVSDHQGARSGPDVP